MLILLGSCSTVDVTVGLSAKIMQRESWLKSQRDDEPCLKRSQVPILMEARALLMPSEIPIPSSPQICPSPTGITSPKLVSCYPSPFDHEKSPLVPRYCLGVYPIVPLHLYIHTFGWLNG